MEFKTYTQEECDRYNAASGILGMVTAICGDLLYNHARTEEEQKAIQDFEEPYAIMRIRMTVGEEDKIDWIYREVKPLIFGSKPKLTLEYILSHPHNGEIF
ncbi:MAG: hypothetical protein LBL04_04935 [Bacteroidales bacterium]|jgi:hypothetical protein|nr:hypothetical protein [Bacteroidales bacterium]